MAASGKIRRKSLKSAKKSVSAGFDCVWFHGIPLNCDKIDLKHDVYWKNICGGVHSYYNSNFKTFRSNENAVFSDMYSAVEVSLHSQFG